MVSIDPAHDGMETIPPHESRTSDDRPQVLTPIVLRDILEKLTEIMRHALHKEEIVSTSNINEPIDHGLLRGILLELRAQDMKLPADVGVVISAIEDYVNDGLSGDNHPLVC